MQNIIPTIHPLITLHKKRKRAKIVAKIRECADVTDEAVRVLDLYVPIRIRGEDEK